MAHYNGNFYIGGGFMEVDGQPNTAGIARWDGVSWSDVAGGIFNGAAYSLQPYNGLLHVGGQSNDYSHIATWNDTSFTTVGGGMSGGITRILTMEVYKGELYAGGDFTSAGGSPAFRIARWDGSQWKKVGQNGATFLVQALKTDTVNDLLYVGGAFTMVDTLTVNFIAQWDGTKWSNVGGGFDCNVYSLGVYHGELYAGGCFTSTAGGEPFNFIARWDGKQWKDLDGGVNASVMAMEVYDDTLFVGGYFNTAGGDSAYYLAKWHTPPCAYLEAGFATSTDTLFMPDSLGIQFTDTTNQSETWLWDFGDGEIDTVQNPMHYYDSSGTYIVTQIINHGNCADTAYDTLVVVGAGVEEQLEISSWQLAIFPNPTDGSFTVEIENANVKMQNVKLKIYDLEGRVVDELEMGNARLTVKTDGWVKGAYICKVVMGSKTVASGKIVLVK